MPKVLYHTIRKGLVVAASVKNAPYRCATNPWLGEGYYFWDSFIELAHWWGETHCRGQYAIMAADNPLAAGDVFDLVGDTGHIEAFAQYARTLEAAFGEEPTVAQVIAHMRKHAPSFSAFKAVRADGRLSVPGKSPYTFRLKFSSDPAKRQYLDLLPSIQYCIFERNDIPPLTKVFES